MLQFVEGIPTFVLPRFKEKNINNQKMEDIDNILSVLEGLEFNFDTESKSASYNPLEYFVEQVSTKEIRHTKILADLLNPDGPHKYGRLFLDSFLDLIQCQIPENCDIKVNRESKVSRVLTEGSDRSIDLLLSWE